MQYLIMLLSSPLKAFVVLLVQVIIITILIVGKMAPDKTKSNNHHIITIINMNTTDGRFYSLGKTMLLRVLTLTQCI